MSEPGQLAGLRLAVLVERGVNEIEFHLCRLRLREAGAEVVVIGNCQLEYEGEDHEALYADVTIDQVDASGFDGVFIPGGLAPEKLRQSPVVVRFVRQLYDRGKVCAAICHGQQVLISAGLLRSRRAVAAWSMVDDLIYTGAVHVPKVRAVRDGTLVTARIFHDLPLFFLLAWEAFAEAEGRAILPGCGERLLGKRVGILADDATDAAQLFYARCRIEEEGGAVVLLGRRAGAQVRLGSPTWEWAERGPSVIIDRSLEDVGAVVSDDLPYDEALNAIHVSDMDGLVVPGGLATWLIRGHPGLRKLVWEMHAAGKPITAIERGAKVLLSAGVLSGSVTGSGEVKDDLIGAGLLYRDEPVVRNGNLLFCRNTADLPDWGRAWVEMLTETTG